MALKDAPGGSVDKSPLASVDDSCSIPGLERVHMLWSS